MATAQYRPVNGNNEMGTSTIHPKVFAKTENQKNYRGGFHPYAARREHFFFWLKWSNAKKIDDPWELLKKKKGHLSFDPEIANFDKYRPLK